MTKRKPPLFQRTRAELGRKTALIWRKMGQDWRKKGKKIIKNRGSEHKSWTSILLCLALWLVCETSLSGIMNLMFYVCVCVCVCAHTHTQSYLTFCHPMKCNPPGSSIYGISQASILEEVAIFFSREIFPTQESNFCLWLWQAGSLPADPPGRSYLFHLNVDVSVRVNCSHASFLASLILTALREDISLDHTGCPWLQITTS